MVPLPGGFWKVLGNLAASGYGLMVVIVLGAVGIVSLIPAPNRYQVIDDLLIHPLALGMLLTFVLVMAILTVYVLKSHLELEKLRDKRKKSKPKLKP